MASILVRLAAPIAGGASRRILASLLFPLPPFRAFPAAVRHGSIHAAPVGINTGAGFIARREFHGAFRSTDAALAPQLAVEDGFYDEGSGAPRKASGSGAGADEGLEISSLGISQDVVSRLAKRGITRLFPIQRAVLEPAMQGRDMIGRARTGTGKTLAFGIPIMDKIIRFNEKHGTGRNPLGLVLAPTRELARQVEKEFSESSKLDTICVYGGTPINAQMRTLDYGVDVVIGTPGRVIDLLKRGSLNLAEVQFVVLDEADQMLSVGFEEDVEVILEKLPRKRQTMMFSATMPTWIRKLTQKYLNDPLTIDLVGDSHQKVADGITLFSIAAERFGKPSILGPLIQEHAGGGKCIVFTQTKRDADQLAYAMGRSHACKALHGDISQAQRERTLSGFRDGHFNILVATDVAARGLDVPNVDLVIHYELPNTSETFVHRTGRTGRAGKKGKAVLIYDPREARAVKVIEQDVGCKFTDLPRIEVDGGASDMFSGRFGGDDFGSRRGDFGGQSRSRGFGGGFGDRSRDDGFGRGGSSFGRSGRGSDGFGSSHSGRFGGGFGDTGPGRFGGSFGESNSRRSGGFSSFGDSESRQSGGFGDIGSRRSGGALGDSNQRNFGRSSDAFGSTSGLGSRNSGGQFGGFSAFRSPNDGNQNK